MWLLNLLPDWIYYLTAIVGIAAILAAKFLSFIPILKQYGLPVSIGGLLLLVVSAWIIGGVMTEQKWQDRVKELEAKVAVAEQKSAQENVKIVNKVVTKLEVVKVRGEEIVKYIDKEVKVYDDQCNIPKVFVEAHNRAAEPLK